MIPFLSCPARVHTSKTFIARLLGRRAIASWNNDIPNPKNQFQIYTSASNDPYVNLSIEHHLFQKSHPGSKILFQYINRPCIVIGRNQNPWLEVNLALLNPSKDKFTPANGTELGNIDLVRRRSGGGTVFHDEGNVNWSVICDFTEFTRDKHAEMVVRALRGIGIERARVNERHDIVLDQGSRSSSSDVEPKDTHRTQFTSEELRPLKVSGSAYKMARNRALHHGTALLSSPNLHVIPHYLHSPAKGHITAKGVESVSSPVSNIGVENDVFMRAVRDQFARQYRVPREAKEILVGDEAMEIEEVRNGVQELKSLEWTYLQTPGFTFSTKSTATKEIDMVEQPYLTFEARHGVITDVQWTQSAALEVDTELSAQLKKSLEGLKIHEQHDWHPLLESSTSAQDAQYMAALLEKMFPPP